MRLWVVLAAVVVAGCAADPEQRADAVCAQAGLRPGMDNYAQCFVPTYNALLQQPAAAPAAVPVAGYALGAGLLAYSAAITPPPPQRFQTTCMRAGPMVNCY